MATLAATDPAMSGAQLTWSIPSGNDGAGDATHFTLSSSGALAFGTAKDYENPDDANGDGVYTVTVRVSNGATTETDLSVILTNVDEAGSLTLRPDQPRVKTVLRARLSDPDGGLNLSAVEWQWQNSSDGDSWNDINDANAASYAPEQSDRLLSLRATATYADGEGSGKSAVGASRHVVAEEQPGPEFTVTTLVSGLTHPWDIAFTPDGTMLFTERAGTIKRRLADGTVQQISADLDDLFVVGTAGLMGIVVDPAFASNRRFYTAQGHSDAGDYEVQVLAWTVDEAFATATRVGDPLVGGMPVGPSGGPNHAGSRMRFGPQGYLWIATGDGYDASASQNRGSLGGKVLRVNATTGMGAPGNPFPLHPLVYSYGHRNPQGLALRPNSSQMWLVDHGPDHDDEINLLTAGGNHGWNPTVDMLGSYYENVPMTDTKHFPDAVEARWSSGYPTLAPSGAIFLEGDDWGAWKGRLAVATLKTKSLRLFKFSSNGELMSEVVVPGLHNSYGRLRTPMLGPDGALYIATANGDEDRLLKVSPSRPPAFPSDAAERVEVSETGAKDSVVTTVLASDPDDEPLTYTLSGSDAANFRIADPRIGQIRAIAALDYETRTSYEIVVTATDPYGLSDSLELTITVTDVDEPQVESIASSATHPTKDPFTLTIRFSKPVTGLTAGEITVDNGAGAGFSGSGTTFTLRVTPNADLEGDVTVTVPAGVAEDSAKNPNYAGSATFAVDTLAPELLATDNAIVNGTFLTLKFDETLAAAATPASAFTVTGGTSPSVIAVSVNAVKVHLTVDLPIPHGETGIELDYNAPSLEALADVAGNRVASFADLVVANRENDPSLVISPSSVTVREGGSATYRVALAAEPSGNVTVTVSGVSGDLSLNATELRYSTGNWGDAQTVRVMAAEDDDTAQDAAVTLIHQAAGGGYDGINGSVRVTLIENDSGGGTGGGGGGGSANRPPVVERQIEDQTLNVGETLELDIRLNFYDRDQRALDYTAESDSTRVVTVEVDRHAVLTLHGLGGGVASVTVTAADRRDERASQSFTVTVLGPHIIPLFPRASDQVREGFARVINHSDEDGEVSIEAIDDRGMRTGPVTLAIDGNAVVHFNSEDLENGNATKGLPEGVGAGEGDWRLVLDSELDLEVLSYTRTEDGFLTSMHDLVSTTEGVHHVAIFNPGSNPDQVSRLRLVNPRTEDAEVTVTGIDDAGASPGTAVKFEVPAGESLTLTASDLERGTGVDGALGDGMGKWRLAIGSEAAVLAMSLLESPTGYLTNLSTVPQSPSDEDDGRLVALFPSASDPFDRQGFVRVVNRSAEPGEVHIEAFDDSTTGYDDITLTLDAGETVHFNSNDLELGNPSKGLAGSTGAGEGDWRLALGSDLDLEVLAYIRTHDGFLTSMHDVAPSLNGRHWVPIFNPGSNRNQVSVLRLVNPGNHSAQVTITGIDDRGVPAAGIVRLPLPAGTARELAASELESGISEAIEVGALGDGTGKWRLTVQSDRPIVVMSLLSSATGHLTNLSAAKRRGVAADTPTSQY